MPLIPGTMVGPYQVIGSLGAGGMGEVYRARDTKLNRDVALKVLPDAVADDRDRLARFQREAQLLATLNHPNIAGVHGLEQSGSTQAIVMEFVEGPTLETVISSHFDLPDPNFDALEWALPIAIQIAGALESAHESGVIHRDLKPANIKVKPDNKVKVLDFGLAKAFDPGASGMTTISGAGQGAKPDTATMTSPAMTEMGMILGTAAYMSPEQARGRAVDKRADIWAFGVVLFEMLTGQRLFGGDTVSDTVAAVLRDAIPWDRLPAATPARVRHVLERCLERDPGKRLRDIGDARLELEDEVAGVGARVGEPIGAGASAAEAPGRSTGHAGLAWAVTALAVIAAVAAWVTRPAPLSSGSEWRYFTQLTDMSGAEDSPAISPDGTSIAYARRVNDSWDLFVQRIGGSNPVVIAGDPARDELWPAFSPDSQLIAFHEGDTDGGIFIVGATGENVRRVTDRGFHATWSPDGRQLAYSTERAADPHARNTESRLWVVDLGTGEERQIVDIDAIQPSWSPSGARIAFWSVPGGQRDIYTVPATGGDAIPVLEDPDLDWGVTWSPDGRYLYFSSERGGTMSLWRIPVDEASGQATGEPEPVLSGVQTAPELPTFSADGTRMVFRSQQVTQNPVAFDVVDPTTLELGPPRYLMQRTGQLFVSDVSPDGEWLALANQGEPLEDIFISRADGSDLRRLTNDPARDRVPRWSPDGRTLIFYSNRGGEYNAWRINRDGSGLTQVTTGAGTDMGFLYPFYSSDGARLYTIRFEVGELLALELGDGSLPGVPTELPPPDVVVDGAASRLRLVTASPDGRLLAGTAMGPAGYLTGIGVYDVGDQTARIVSSDRFNGFPAFMPDGRRLIYVAEQQLVAVSIDGTNRRVLARDLPFEPSVQIALSPDGRAIYLAGRVRAADIWMVERQRNR